MSMYPNDMDAYFLIAIGCRIFRVLDRFDDKTKVQHGYISAKLIQKILQERFCIDSTIVRTYLYYSIKTKCNYVFAKRARTML